jgi:very-short-patch-repair endonuclease
MSKAIKGVRRQIRLEAQAHGMRSAPTEPERVLWRSLRRSQLGVRFRRQVVLYGFIADFFAPWARLIVEVDGPHHDKRQRQDARRDALLVAQGLRVLRLPAELVLREMPKALRLVTEALHR